jgi:hypothetical protein
VLVEHIAELVELGRRLLAVRDEFEAISTWLRAALMHGVTYRVLSAAVMNSELDRGKGVVAAWRAEMFR